jgi:hypothetical protein
MTTVEIQQVIDRSDLRKWRIELPNLYDDADLTVYEFRMLVHYKRVGICYEGLTTTANKCHMSLGQASAVRMSLKNKGWIKLTEIDTPNGPGYQVEVIDRWEENFAHYSHRATGFHVVKGDPSSPEAKPSPGESHPSPGERKKEQVKNKPFKNTTTSRRGATPSPKPGWEHPAIQTLKTMAGMFVPAGLIPQLITILGTEPDLEKLQKCYDEWHGRGKAPKGWEWATKWYPDGIPDRPVNGGNHGQAHSGRGTGIAGGVKIGREPAPFQIPENTSTPAA